jgi:dipeptidyl aminopeptidase/acylaminoacyl peptidase
VPVLMAYGRNDPRVKISQGYAIEAALKRSKVPYKMIIQEDEGHGFSKEEKSIPWYKEIEDFLDAHLSTDKQGTVNMEPFKILEMPVKSD